MTGQQLMDRYTRAAQRAHRIQTVLGSSAWPDDRYQQCLDEMSQSAIAYRLLTGESMADELFGS